MMSGKRRTEKRGNDSWCGEINEETYTYRRRENWIHSHLRVNAQAAEWNLKLQSVAAALARSCHAAAEGFVDAAVRAVVEKPAHFAFAWKKRKERKCKLKRREC